MSDTFKYKLWCWSISQPQSPLKAGVTGYYIIGWRGGLRSWWAQFFGNGPPRWLRDRKKSI